jgi:Ca-activated chloride channel family protein
MVSWLAAAGALVACAAAEWLHARRVRRVARLAFGPAARPRRWVALVPALRAASAAAACWGLVVLYQIDRAQRDPPEPNERAASRRLVIALDVSPSMQLADAGPKGRQPRGERARDVLRSALERLDQQRIPTSVVAFYSDARPVVVDTIDPEVVANILDDLPLEHAFAAGKTNLYRGAQAAGQLGKAWPARSAVLLLVSDGDTLPPKEAPRLPAAFGGVLVVGVGNPRRGLYIDDHSSRQDVQSLQRLALQLGGTYNDANQRHVPTEGLRRLAAHDSLGKGPGLERREAAVAALSCGAAVLALLPLALALAGRMWRPSAAPLRQPAAQAARSIAPHQPAAQATTSANTSQPPQRGTRPPQPLEVSHA